MYDAAIGLRAPVPAVRSLLTESGSIFVQIGNENVHRVRDLMDEVFGATNAALLGADHWRGAACSAPLAASRVRLR